MASYRPAIPATPVEPWRFARWVALTLVAVGFVAQYEDGTPWTTRGLPLEREQLIAWVLLASIAWSLGRSRIEIIYAVAGWGALGACFILYDYTRGAIDGWWGHPVNIPGSSTQVPSQSVHNAERIITAERAFFFGQMPTEWLQHHLYRASTDDYPNGPVWEIAVGLTYISHFVVVYAIALFQWFRDRVKWFDWVRALVTLIVFGIIGYLLFPTAPPWLADRFALMGTVVRPGTRGVRQIHLETADRLWRSKADGSFNIVAAMPSLHFAFTTLVLFFFWRTAKRWLRVILVVYPCLMLFALVYGGEHYVMDCVVGAALAWLAVWVNRRFDAWRDARRVVHEQPEQPAPHPPAPSSAPVPVADPSLVTSAQNLSEDDTDVSLPLRS